MEDTPTPNSNFEKLLRNQLEQLDAAPDENTWAQIIDKQHPKNNRLRIRHYGIHALLVVIATILAVAGWRYDSQHGNTPAREPATEHPENPALPPELGGTPPLPVAGALPANPKNGASATVTSKPYSSPIFGNRINTVPAATVRFQAETGLRYQSPITGTSVHIPANSLRDANGKPVTGEVDLLFREYRDIPDFLAAGIPMHYADERGTFSFNSGGMFEIRAIQYGEPLQMASGQKYDVVFSPTNPLTKASLFYLDDATGAWSYRPDPAFVAQKDQLPPIQAPIATESEVLKDNKRAKGPNCLPETVEISSIKDPAGLMKAAVQTGYDLATSKMTMPIWFRKNSGLSNEQLLNGLERTRVRIVQHKDQKELFFPEDVNKVFTELDAFKGCYFTRALDSMNGSRGNKRLNPNEYWQRITVAQELGAYCQITLYGEQGWMQFYATMQASTGNENFNPDRIMAEYRRLRTERQNDIETLANKLRNFLFVAPAFQTQEEWCMEASEWLTYFNENHSMMSKRYAALIKAGLTTNDSIALAAWTNWRTRLRNLHFDRHEQADRVNQSGKQNLAYAVQISEFGIYNCDQIFRIGNENIYAGYRTPDGGRVVAASVSIIERRTRLFFTLPSNNQMLRAPGRRLDIVVTDRNGRCFHLPADKYASIDFGTQQSNVFTVTDVTDKMRTPRDWANLLEM